MYQLRRSLPLFLCTAMASLSSGWSGPGGDGWSWSGEGDQADAWYGWAVAAAGDVDGDGYEDVLVGAPFYDHPQSWEGRALLYLGSAGGLRVTASWSGEGDQDSALYGFALAWAGDVNGDGFADVIVGAPRATAGQAEEGRVYVYLGSPTGLASAAAWTAESDVPLAEYGSSVASAGDVNGDGFDDVLVGAYWLSNGEPREGAAYLYLGSPSGLGSQPAWYVESNQADALFGYAVAGAGDVNGDGYDDIVVGARQYSLNQTGEGAAFAYYGSPSGPSTTASWVCGGIQGWAAFGSSLSGAGDVNADGYDDLVVGSPYFNDAGQDDEGRIQLFLGSATGLSPFAAWSAQGNSPLANLGDSVAGAGDVNQDGYADVLAGAPFYSHELDSRGRVTLYLGCPAGLSTHAAWSSLGEQSQALLGDAVASAGDVDGDGAADLLLGAPAADHDQVDEGMAFVYSGLQSLCGEIGTRYCMATQHSAGEQADLSAWCSASATAASLRLIASPVPDSFGVFVHGRDAVELPFGNGWLCVASDLVRSLPRRATERQALHVYDGSDATRDLLPYVGTTRYFQYWFRDPDYGGLRFNASTAVSLAIQP